MKSKVNVDSPDKKNVTIEINEMDRRLAITLPPKDAGMVAASLLGICRQLPATQNKASTDQPSEWAYLRATQVALGPSPDRDCEAMIFGFGDAQLAVSVSRKNLRTLGESLIALSAQGRPD